MNSMNTERSDSVCGFDKETIVQLKEAFDFLDLDKSGMIAVEEVHFQEFCTKHDVLTQIGYLMCLLKLDNTDQGLEEVMS